MPKIDMAKAEHRTGSGYPSPYDEPCRGRSRRRLGNVADLTQFGVNLLRLEPGAWSSQRHWHALEDEFVYVLEGEVVLVTDAGEETLRPGDSAGFKAGVADGHHLQNRSSEPVLVLEIGGRAEGERVVYPGIDLLYDDALDYTRVDGTPYPKRS